MTAPERASRGRGDAQAERQRSLARDLTPRQKGLALAYLVFIVGGLALALPLAGIVDYEQPARDECVPGYSKCLDPAARDYDCEGEGNGPRYVSGPIVVAGSDRFGLDPDRDGFGCE